MSLPKALLCVLGKRKNEPLTEEIMLNAAGFHTAVIHWTELASVQRGWIQLLPTLEDPALKAWVLSGPHEDFTDEVLGQVAMLSLAMSRPSPPMMAFVLTSGNAEPELTDLLGHVKIYKGNTTFAAKIAAARVKPQPGLKRAFHIHARLDPYIGQWFEVGPADGESWNGFTVGVVGAEVTAFGVGRRGKIPEKSTLQYPQLGIKGQLGFHEFHGCAAKNHVGSDAACFVRIEGTPRIIFITGYPDETSADTDSRLCLLELV